MPLDTRSVHRRAARGPALWALAPPAIAQEFGWKVVVWFQSSSLKLVEPSISFRLCQMSTTPRAVFDGYVRAGDAARTVADREAAFVELGDVHHEEVGARDNTVQLATHDGDHRWPGGLGPSGVTCALDVPLRHLALDDVGIRASATSRVESSEQLDDRLAPGDLGRRAVLRGKKRPVGRRIGERCAVLRRRRPGRGPRPRRPPPPT